MRWRTRLPFRPRDWSLHRQLVIWVVVPQLVLWLGGGIATYRLAVRYVDQAADATLLQATRALARQVKPIGNGLLIDLPRAAQDVLETDPNDRLLYTVSTPPGKFILGNNNLPAPPATAVPRFNLPYFYDGEVALAGATARTNVRIAALYLAYGESRDKSQWMLVQVARSMANRHSIWKSILIDTLLPLSGLIFLMTVIVWAAIGAGLAPLLRLRRQVEGRSPVDLAPLRIESAPREVRALVAALNTLLASVRQNVDAQKRFIAYAAHQLRTPLAGLKMHAELALAATDDPALLPRLRILQESATRGAHLVNRLLMLARAEPEAAIGRETAPLDLRALVRSKVSELVPRALRAGVDLGMADDSDDGAGPLTVVGNDILLDEALANVLENAIEYAGRGSEVTVTVGAQGMHAQVIVSDNGPGVPEAIRESMFERFVRATDQGLGCGLGLAIVREIILGHHGSVALRQTVPHGLTVLISLPLDAPPGPAGATPH
jgi:two-component system, OmpR family, sensor histidine kinase TctE